MSERTTATHEFQGESPGVCWFVVPGAEDRCGLPADAPVHQKAEKCVKCGDSEGVYPSGTCKSPRCQCKCEFAPVHQATAPERLLLTLDTARMLASERNTLASLQRIEYVPRADMDAVVAESNATRIAEVEHWVTRYNELEAWRVQQSQRIAALESQLAATRDELTVADDALEVQVETIKELRAALTAKEKHIADYYQYYRKAFVGLLGMEIDHANYGDIFVVVEGKLKQLTAKEAEIAEAKSGCIKQCEDYLHNTGQGSVCGLRKQAEIARLKGETK